MKTQYLFIVNPNAGNGKAGKDWVKIEKQLVLRSIYYKAVLTTYPGHALQIVNEEIRLGYKIIVVVGGDGTLNEVVNGIFKQKAVKPEDLKLGIIPVGTGNDWARYYKIPANYKKALEHIFNHKEQFQDVGRVRSINEDKQELDYFVNIAGFGFDSLVVESTNSMQERGNRAGIAYFFNLLKCLFSYKSQFVTLEIESKKIEKKIFSISIGIGKYSGGGMMQTPDAIIDDGYFDLTWYEEMNAWKVIRNVNKLYNGKINKLDTVSTIKCKKLRVSNGKGLLCEIDGEIINADTFVIDILPSALKVMI